MKASEQKVERERKSENAANILIYIEDKHAHDGESSKLHSHKKTKQQTLETCFSHDFPLYLELRSPIFLKQYQITDRMSFQSATATTITTNNNNCSQ